MENFEAPFHAEQFGSSITSSFSNLDTIMENFGVPLPLNAEPSKKFGSSIISSLSNLNTYFNVFYDNTNNANVALTTYSNSYQKTTPSFKQYTKDAKGALAYQIPMALSNENAYNTNYASASNEAVSFIKKVKSLDGKIEEIQAVNKKLNVNYNTALSAAASASNAYIQLSTKFPKSTYKQKALANYNSAKKQATVVERNVKLADNTSPSQPIGYVPQILKNQGAFNSSVITVQRALDVASKNNVNVATTDTKLKNIITLAKALGAYAPAAAPVAKEGYESGMCAALSPLFYMVLVLVALLTIALVVWAAHSMHATSFYRTLSRPVTSKAT